VAFLFTAGCYVVQGLVSLDRLAVLRLGVCHLYRFIHFIQNFIHPFD